MAGHGGPRSLGAGITVLLKRRGMNHVQESVPLPKVQGALASKSSESCDEEGATGPLQNEGSRPSQPAHFRKAWTPKQRSLGSWGPGTPTPPRQTGNTQAVMWVCLPRGRLLRECYEDAGGWPVTWDQRGYRDQGHLQHGGLTFNQEHPEIEELGRH